MGFVCRIFTVDARDVTLLVVYLVGRVGDALRRKALFRAFVITATPHTVRICAAAAFRQVGESLAEATDNADIRDSGLPPLEGRRRGHFRTMLQLAELGVSRLVQVQLPLSNDAATG